MEQGKLDFYSELEEIEQVIVEVFELNPHSVHTLTKHKHGVYAVALDNLNIVYMMNEDKTNITIVKVIYQDNKNMDSNEGSDKLRTR